MKDASLHYSDKENPVCYLPTGFPEMGSEDESRCWLRGSCFHKHLRGSTLLPSENNVRSCRSSAVFYAKS